MTEIVMWLALLTVLALAVVFLIVRIRSLQVSLAWTRRRLEDTLEDVRRRDEAIRHQEIVEASIAAERDTLRSEVDELRRAIEDLSKALSAARAEGERLSSELNTKVGELARARTAQAHAWSEMLEWIAQIFSPYLADVVPENADVIEKYAEKLSQSGLSGAAVEWYAKLAEACLRFGDLARADRASAILKGLRPEDTRIAELRSRVLLHLGRISEARTEKSRQGVREIPPHR